MLTLTGEELEDLIRRVISYRPPKLVMKNSGVRSLDVLGSFLHCSSPLERRVLEIAAARMGCRTVSLGWDDAQRISAESILREFNMYSDAVDVLVSAFIDNDTFGAGRRVLERLGAASGAPLVNLSDDIYAPQSALAVTAAFWEHLGGLKGKNIAISWGFGSKHVLPSTAHSLCLLGATLGANIKVVSPVDFPLLNRVLRGTQDRVKTAEGGFEECHVFNSFDDVDAVYALNWCRLDDFNRPERNIEYASKYRNWHFTKDVLPQRALFVTRPPVQTELLADHLVIDSDRNITPKIISWMVQALMASVSYVIEDDTKHSVLL